MAYQDYTVKLIFAKDESGAIEYELPHIQQVSDPKEGIKATVIHGTRGDGCIVVPGGKKSQEIMVRGILFDNDGYKDLTTLMNTMRNNVVTDVATLTLKHLEGAVWITDWSYTVRRIDEIRFPQSMRTESQEYEINFLVLAY